MSLVVARHSSVVWLDSLAGRGPTQYKQALAGLARAGQALVHHLQTRVLRSLSAQTARGLTRVLREKVTNHCHRSLRPLSSAKRARDSSKAQRCIQRASLRHVRPMLT